MVHSRLAPITAILAVLASAGCSQQPQNATGNVEVSAPAEPKSVVPVPQPKLDREGLIFAALRALSAAALGADDRATQAALKGREFELRLRFGCPGMAAAARPSRNWSYDDQKHVLRAHVSTDLSADHVPASDLLLKGYEGVAGFTIDRPLLLAAGCPNAQFGSATAVEPTLALAQLFTSDDSRIQRPERSYEITKAVAESAKPTQGLELVVGGRLSGLSDGRVIHCAAADGPPACIIAAKLDRVAIENPADGSVLGEWSQW